MKKAIISAVLALSLTCIPLSNVQSSFNVHTHADSQNITGLIEKCSLSVKTENDRIYIYAKTQASGNMTETGFLDIRVQHSDDCVIWTD